jgi:putative hydrolase of the HAD superfamily
VDEPGVSPTVSSVFSGLCSPMEPLPADVEARPDALAGVRAVLFDVYGTLVISAATGGDVDPARAPARAAAMDRAVRVAGLRTTLPASELLDRYDAQLRSALAARRDEGFEHPEAEIRAVWRAVLDGADVTASDERLEHLAAAFEAGTNPTWPMPGARACLQALRDAPVAVGLVSNAQFYTLPMLEALFGAAPTALGIDSELVVLSGDHGRGKPDPWLYSEAARRLAARGIAADAVLHVGNDMLKDVWAARQAGLRTALFAGDGRSLQLRADDPRVAGLRPDLVLTDLATLPGCLAG